MDRCGGLKLSAVSSSFARSSSVWPGSAYIRSRLKVSKACAASDAGALESEVANLPRHRQVDLEIVKRSDDMTGFKVLPKRWIVERTFGWLIQSRRLVRDYEVKMEHTEAMIYLSMGRRMLARIAA